MNKQKRTHSYFSPIFVIVMYLVVFDHGSLKVLRVMVESRARGACSAWLCVHDFHSLVSCWPQLGSNTQQDNFGNYLV